MIYERNRGVCWAAASIPVPVMTLSLVLGLLLLATWAAAMVKVRG